MPTPTASLAARWLGTSRILQCSPPFAKPDSNFAANLIYTDNGNEKYEEWNRLPATIEDGHRVTARLPDKATHYVFNLIDENHYLVSYPRMKTPFDKSEPYSAKAIATRE